MTYQKDPKAYVEQQSEGAQALLAFDDYCKTDEGKILKTRVDLDADMFTIFEAGWKAARKT